MRWNDSLVVATKLMEIVLSDPQAEGVKGTIHCYSNGREQGFAIIYPDQKTFGLNAVIFAQDRHSDQIVVYHGDYTFETLSEEVYKRKRLFHPDRYDLAKDYIMSCLLADQMC